MFESVSMFNLYLTENTLIREGAKNSWWRTFLLVLLAYVAM